MRKHNKMNAKRIAYLCVILVLVLVMILSGLQILESTVFHFGQEPTQPRKTLIRDGVEYFPRQDITVVMVLGIDRFGAMVPSGSYNNSGAADMVSLLIFDEQEKTCNVLCINRDTMLEMPVLGLGGKYAGTIVQQLALAHTYGTGMEDSCENTRTAVSQFLYGIQIDHYIAMNMDAISILNDAVGGVTVTVEDDFSEIDPTITMGQLTLKGEQAIHFVRTRKNVDDQTNISRMRRQEQYMDGFVEAFRAKQAQSTAFITETYENVSDYIVSDLSVKAIISLMDRFAEYRVGDVQSLEGQNVMGDVYFEFYADEKKLDEAILSLFYSAKK